MCLLTPKGSRKIAEDDIHVLKIIRHSLHPKFWDGPFFRTNLMFEEMGKTEPPDEKDLNETQDGHVICDEGFFHAFLNIAEARSFFDRLGGNRPGSQLILTTATVPKGALYYIGKADSSAEDTAIASNKLIVHKPTWPVEWEPSSIHGNNIHVTGSGSLLLFHRNHVPPSTWTWDKFVPA